MVPLLASNTTTPTGEVSISASRSALARCSSAVGAGVGDRGGRLRGEQHQDLFVLAGELPAALLVAEEEVPDVGAPVVASASPGCSFVRIRSEEKPSERT